MISYSILVTSDKGSAGLREDRSGPAIQEMLTGSEFELVEYKMVPDDLGSISRTLVELAARANLVLTSGGTGFSPRDVTPEATLAVIERQVPGIPEAMRAKSLSITPRAMLSRAVAGIYGQALIINLPGSPKAVRECLEVIIPVLPHAIAILTAQAGECGETGR